MLLVTSRPSVVSPRRLLLAALALAASGPGSTAAGQTTAEPIMTAVRAATSQPGLTLGMLLQAVADPSVDGSDPDPASVQVAAMRLRLGGTLDAGFSYLFQTNLAASPSILDARVGWSATNGLSVFAGRFKTQFSRELLTYAGSIDFVNRARVSWTPTGASDENASGLYVTAGWMVGARTQVLARWDRYEAPGADPDDAAVLGLNVWPTTASEVQVNWVAPVADSSAPHKILVNFQVGF